MKRIVIPALVGSLALAVSGALAGCSAGVSVDPPRSTSSSTTTVRPAGDSTYKKTEVRDANGNLIERKVESKSGY